MPTPGVTATIITFNEENNLARALKSLSWVDEIIVVDSGSTDQTPEIAKKFDVKYYTNPWPGYGKQKNFAQQMATNPWVLNIDADEEVSPELASELQALLQKANQNALTEVGFYIPRKTFYMNKWIKHGGWYPNYLVRFSHKDHSQWTEPQVHEALVVQGKIGKLNSPLHHFTFTDIADQVQTNIRYAKFGAKDLALKGQKPSLLKLIFKPLGKFIETYILKKGFLDGIAGLIISVNAAHSMFLKYAYLFETKNEGQS